MPRGVHPTGEAAGPRHSPEWYDQGDDPFPLAPGDRLFVPCLGGPSSSRLETFPPRLELIEEGGTYVLTDDGSRHDWHYVWVPAG